MSSKIYLYPHPSSLNHGCEAIAEGTGSIIKKYIPDASTCLLTKYNEGDPRGGTKDVYSMFSEAVQCSMPSFHKWTKDWIVYQLSKRIFGRDNSLSLLSKAFSREHFDIMEKGDLFISIGGDNYCYGRPVGLYAVHKAVAEHGKRTVLWGCSIEPSAITHEMVEDLKKYDAIVARESLTFEALQEKGLNNVLLYPDPAFTLKPKKSYELDSDTVGINVSPMILEYAKYGGLVYAAFKKLIDHILSNTNFRIALIPHVTASTTNDYVVLSRLKSDFIESDRLVLYDDMSCGELKYIIKQCRFFIGARTHATIAAYSSCIPTLVCGYSIKAKGIAKDLFGDFRNYVVSVQDIKTETVLVNAFIWLVRHEKSIRDHLKEVMPNIIGRAWQAGEVLMNAIR